MNNEELSELIGSLGEDNPGKERENESLSSLRASYTFSPYFTNRVLMAIEGKKRFIFMDDLTLRINSLFFKVAVTGAAAIIILAVSVFLSGGTISFDSLLGIGNASDESMISLLTGN